MFSGWLGRRALLLVVSVGLAAFSCTTIRTWAQPAASAASADLDRLTLTTDAAAPLRFIAAHGQRAVMMGYPEQGTQPGGLEMWAYPVQVVSGYRIAIQPVGAARVTSGELLLRRIEVRPQETTRIYVGADFVVRERIFVPIDRPGAIVTYTVEGRRAVDITIEFTPVLDLMWPAAIGGQSAEWRDALSGYLLREPLHRFSAAIVSPNIIAHDSTENTAVPLQRGLAFTMRPKEVAGGTRVARVFLGLDGGKGGGEDTASTEEGSEVKALAAQQLTLESQAAKHYADLLTTALRIETPDEHVNQALAWAEIALDQAWACDPGVGCALVAGYGPSRRGRRPQYDWFFAGDGLIAADGLLAASEPERARQELEFILKYQDAKTGMIWHELSQSASYLDWVGKYPYMYVHVDITFQFLSMVGRYLATTGDVDFAQQHWAALEAAYRYCRAVIDPVTQLPRIPEGKEGGNEQDRMSDDLGLSSQWMAAAGAFAELAKVTGHRQLEVEARHSAEASRPAIARRYWDATRQFWLSGHTDAGKPIFEERSSGGGLIAEHVFSAEQDATLLDKLASADFQADWGTRSVSTEASTYDPDSYGRGSVFVLHTAGMAPTFWRAHRPVTAQAIWNTLPPLTWLDALGHMHEVLAGDFYHQQTESVAEQTWSSASFMDTTVHGLLGLQVEANANRILFAPHMPASWQHLSVSHLRTRHATLDLKLQRSEGAIALDIDSTGAATDMVFDPEIPLGARNVAATCAGRSVPVVVEQNSQDEHARMGIHASPGATHCEMQYQGGVQILPDPPDAQVGDTTRALKFIDVTLERGVLTVAVDAHEGHLSGFDLMTTDVPVALEGGDVKELSKGRYRVTLSRNAAAGSQRQGYVRRSVRIRVAGEASAGK